MQLLFKDENLVVIEKPVGFDSEKQVPEKIKEMCGGEVFTVHRLDLNVGGIMVYARNKKTASYLSKCIQENTMIKEYVAKVHGNIETKGDFIDFLFKDSRKNKVFVVKKERKGVKKARLEYVCLKQEEDTSLIQVRLHTGRSHQIRVQFASRGYPLLGDHKYGSKDKLTSPMLYSCRISFPYKKETITFTSLPEWADVETLESL